VTSVAELLELPVFQRARPEILVGNPSVDVRWVHTSEIFDIGSLLEGGELLLTTGLGLVRESEPRMRDYVRRISEHRAAGLILELGRTYSSPPEVMVDEATRRGLLFGVLHEVVPWVQVTEAAHRVILGGHVEGLESAHHTNRALMDAVLECESLDALTQILTNITHGTIGIESPPGFIVWSNGPVAENEQTVRFPLSSLTRASSTDITVLVPARSAPPLVRDFLSSMLEVWWALHGESERRKPEAHRSRLASVVNAAPSLDSTHRRVLIDLGVEPQRTKPTFAYAAFARNGTLSAATVERQAQQFFHRCVAVESEDAVLLLARDKVSSALDGLEILAPIATGLRAQGLEVTVLEGEPQASLAGLGREIDDLLLLAANPQMRRTHQAHIPRHETNLLRLLSHLDDIGRAERFVNQELSPILAHDAAHRPPLMPTLLAYLASDSKKDAAAELGISRQAMHARIGIVEELLDLGPGAPLARRAAVSLAALMWQWRNTGSL